MVDDNLSKEVVLEQIEEVENEIEYEEEKLKCCAYGRRELMYLEELKEKLAELEKLLENLE